MKHFLLQIPRMLFIVLYFSITLIFVVVLAVFIRSEDFSPIDKAKVNSIIILNELKTPREEVSSYYVTESQIFINYEKNRLVNVYSGSGEFQYGIVYGDYPNGRTAIGYDSKSRKLYILARGSIAYTLIGTELVECFEYYQDPSEYKRIEADYIKEMHSNNEGEYVLTSEGIVLCSSNEQKQIIRFPQKDHRIETCLVLFAIFNLSSAFLSKYCLKAK